MDCVTSGMMAFYKCVFVGGVSTDPSGTTQTGPRHEPGSPIRSGHRASRPHPVAPDTNTRRLHDRGNHVHAIGTPLNVGTGTDQAGTDPRPVVQPDEPQSDCGVERPAHETGQEWAECSRDEPGTGAKTTRDLTPRVSIKRGCGEVINRSLEGTVEGLGSSEDPVLHGLRGADSVSDQRFLDWFEVPDREAGCPLNLRETGRIVRKEDFRGTSQGTRNARTIGLAKGGVGDSQGDPGSDEPPGNGAGRSTRWIQSKVSGATTIPKRQWRAGLRTRNPERALHDGLDMQMDVARDDGRETRYLVTAQQLLPGTGFRRVHHR